MIRPRFFLLFLCMQQIYEASCMTCRGPLGIDFNCPTMFHDQDKAFCCYSGGDVAYCCEIGEYVQNNTAIIAGVAVGAIILLIICTLCCCCFCSCCLLAKRRGQPGRVLYDPIASQAASTASPYIMPPAMPPQPVLASGYYQPPVNPNFKG